jgi:putative membrane protein
LDVTNRTYRTFQAFLMAALGFFLLERTWAGRLAIYINRRFIWLVLAAAFGLMALAITTYKHRPPVWTEDEGLLAPEMAPKNARRRLLIFTIPLLLGIFIPATPLGASVAENRGVSAAAPLSAGGEAPETLTQDPADRSLLEWLWAFDAAEDPQSLSGGPVDVEGFIFINSELPEDYLMVGRFVVTCCVADATAIGIAVLPPAEMDVPNGWVRVKGEMTITSFNGTEALLILPEKITPAEEPNQPYLYP